MRKIIYLSILGFLIYYPLFSQKINTDSLLVEGLKSLKSQNLEKTIELGRLGIKIAPEYTDFYMLLGRAFMKKGKVESAQYYFKHVIETAPIYRDAFSNSINLDIQTKNYDEALFTANEAIKRFDDNIDFYYLKLKTLQLKDDNQLIDYLNEIVLLFPQDVKFEQALRVERSKFNSDRIGINNSYSIFNRDGIGPWNLTAVQYIRERKKSTLIGNISYADRQSNGSSLISGYQFELGAYFKTGMKGTSITNVAFSPDIVFPELLLSYSYLYNFDSGWEVDAGIRYIRPNNQNNIFTTVAGVGKYFGSSWLNFNSFLFFEESKRYLSAAVTYRYYFNTKYDYIAVITGYGSSPDENNNLISFDQQISLNSYRIGMAYNRVLGKKVILGIQFIANHQEYIENRFQNQYDFFVSIQYKL